MRHGHRPQDGLVVVGRAHAQTDHFRVTLAHRGQQLRRIQVRRADVADDGIEALARELGERLFCGADEYGVGRVALGQEGAAQRRHGGGVPVDEEYAIHVLRPVCEWLRSLHVSGAWAD